MDISVLEKVIAMIVLAVGAITAIIKIPDALIAMTSNKKKATWIVNSRLACCWISTSKDC